MDSLEKNPTIKQKMIRIANEKNNYYEVLKDELRLKYRSKVALDKLYQDRKED